MEATPSSTTKIFKVRKIVHKVCLFGAPFFLVTHGFFFFPLLWYMFITHVLPEPQWYSSLGNLIVLFFAIVGTPFSIGIAYQTIWTWFGQCAFSVEHGQLIVRKFIGERQTKESSYNLDRVWNWSVRKDEEISTSLARGAKGTTTCYTCQIVYEGKLVELLSCYCPDPPAELGAFLAEFMPAKEYHPGDNPNLSEQVPPAS